jgi:hypothetical protein
MRGEGNEEVATTTRQARASRVPIKPLARPAASVQPHGAHARAHGSGRRGHVRRHGIQQTTRAEASQRLAVHGEGVEASVHRRNTRAKRGAAGRAHAMLGASTSALWRFSFRLAGFKDVQLNFLE